MHWYVNRRLHVSWHIAWFSAGILAGTALILVVPQHWFASLAWLFVSLCLFGLVLLKPFTGMVAAAFVSGMILGLWRGSLEYGSFNQYRQYFHKTVTVQGKVGADGDYDLQGEQQLELNTIVLNGQSLGSTVWVSTVDTQQLKRGDTVVVKGRLHLGFGGIPAAMFRAQLVRVERPISADFVSKARDTFAETVRHNVPDPQASLGLGFLVGQQGLLPEELNQQLKMTGLSHVVVASGYNLTILVVLARQLFERLSKYLATVAASLMIVGFITITGFSPSMSRAGLVTGLSLAAWYYGRQIHPLVLLPFAASITVLVKPAYIWGDIGWYLSFLAFTGVLLAAPLLQAYFWPADKKPGLFSAILLGTFSAQLSTLPLLLMIFGQLPIYALPANMFVLPLVPIAMLLTFVGGLVSLLLPGFATIASWPSTVILQLITAIVEWIAQWPNAQLDITFPWWAMVVSYALIVILLGWLQRKTKYSFKANQENTILF